MNPTGIFWRLILGLGTDSFNKFIDFSKRDRVDMQIIRFESEFGEHLYPKCSLNAIPRDTSKRVQFITLSPTPFTKTLTREEVRGTDGPERLRWGPRPALGQWEAD